MTATNIIPYHNKAPMAVHNRPTFPALILCDVENSFTESTIFPPSKISNAQLNNSKRSNIEM
jgi:hypothetical protein